jgi:hypothetical protein
MLDDADVGHGPMIPRSRHAQIINPLSTALQRGNYFNKKATPV